MNKVKRRTFEQYSNASRPPLWWTQYSRKNIVHLSRVAPSSNYTAIYMHNAAHNIHSRSAAKKRSKCFPHFTFSCYFCEKEQKKSHSRHLTTSTRSEWAVGEQSPCRFPRARELHIWKLALRWQPPINIYNTFYCFYTRRWYICREWLWLSSQLQFSNSELPWRAGLDGYLRFIPFLLCISISAWKSSFLNFVLNSPSRYRTALPESVGGRKECIIKWHYSKFIWKD